MAESITIKALQDASLDAKSLEEVVNGNDVKQVTTRKGETYPSVKKAIKTLFENGGLPATPFATKALMTASALADGDYAQVTDDTVNNGLYVKTAGAWVKSAYNLYSNIEVDNKVKVVSDKTEQLSIEIAPISKAVKVQRGKALHQWVDADSDIVAEIDADAGLRLVGVEGTVQDVLNSKKDKSDGFAGNIKDLTHAFLDTDDKILMGIDEHSGLRLKGSNVSLQEQLNWRAVKTPHWENHPNEMFTAECDKYFTNMSISGLQNAPVPYGIMPQRYTVHDNIVNELSLSPPTTHYPIDTIYRPNDQVVHPYVCEFKGGFRGFRYLMCINPYFIESHENPVLFGSNDLHKWDLLEGFKQPLQTPATGHFFSDSGITYDPINGMLVCYWRDGLSSGTSEEEAENPTSLEQEVRYSATRDGIHWTEPKVMASRRPDEFWTSLSIVFNPTDGLFHLFSKVSGKGEINHYTSRTLSDNWEFQSTSFMDALWHKEVKFVGDKYLLLVNKRDPLSNFYFAISSDGNTWTKGAFLFTEQQAALYKASFLPKFNEAGEIAFDILYTTNHTPDPTIKRRFYHVTTNYVSI